MVIVWLLERKLERKAESERKKPIDIYKCARKNSLWVQPVTPFPWKADARKWHVHTYPE